MVPRWTTAAPMDQERFVVRPLIVGHQSANQGRSPQRAALNQFAILASRGLSTRPNRGPSWPIQKGRRRGSLAAPASSIGQAPDHPAPAAPSRRHSTGTGAAADIAIVRLSRSRIRTWSHSAGTRNLADI
jgi:hypothetical protein